MDLVLPQGSAAKVHTDVREIFDTPLLSAEVTDGDVVGAVQVVERTGGSADNVSAGFTPFSPSSFSLASLLPPATSSAFENSAYPSSRSQQPAQIPFASPASFFSFFPLPEASTESAFISSNIGSNTAASTTETPATGETSHFNACLFALTQIQQQEQANILPIVNHSLPGTWTRQQRRGAVSERGLDSLTPYCLPRATPLQYPLLEPVANRRASKTPEKLVGAPEDKTDSATAHVDLKLNADMQAESPLKRADSKRTTSKRRQDKAASITIDPGVQSGERSRASGRAEDLFEYLKQQYPASASTSAPAHLDFATPAIKTVTKHMRKASSVSTDLSPSFLLKRPSATTASNIRKKLMVSSRKGSDDTITDHAPQARSTEDVKEDQEICRISPPNAQRDILQFSPLQMPEQPICQATSRTCESSEATPIKAPFLVGSHVVFWVEKNGFTVKLFGQVDKMIDSTADISVQPRPGTDWQSSPATASDGVEVTGNTCCRVPFQNILALDQALALGLSV